jgi:hypothetical protein
VTTCFDWFPTSFSTDTMTTANTPNTANTPTNSSYIVCGTSVGRMMIQTLEDGYHPADHISNYVPAVSSQGHLAYHHKEVSLYDYYYIYYIIYYYIILYFILYLI